MHYGTKRFGPFYVMWERNNKHIFLTFGIGRLEFQANLWPKSSNDDE